MPKRTSNHDVALALVTLVLAGSLGSRATSDSPDPTRSLALPDAVGAGAAPTTSAVPQAGVAIERPLAPVAESQAQPRGTAQLHGRVIDESTQAPIRHALVTLSGPVSADAQTDDHGRVSFTGLPTGRYMLTVTKAGYVESPPASRRAHTSRKPFRLHAGAIHNVEVPLSPGGVLSGVVTDERGEPIVDAWVRAITAEPPERSHRIHGMLSDRTDDQGGFRIHSLALGEYVVVVDPPQRRHVARARPTPQQRSGQQARRGYVRTFHPGTSDPTLAQPVPIAPGEEQSFSFSLAPVTLSSVSGTVVSPTGRRPTVSLNPDIDFDVGGWAVVSVGASGAFSFSDVVPGRYVLSARSGGHFAKEPTEVADLSIEVTEEPITGLTVTMAPAGTIVGDVVWDGDPSQTMTALPSQPPGPRPPVAMTGGAAYGGPVAPLPREAGSSNRRTVTIRADPVRSTPATIHSRPAKLGADNRFTLQNVLGPIRLRVTGLPPGWVVKTIEAQGRDTTTLALDVAPGQSIDARIVVTNRVARVAGRVEDEQGAPVEAAYVLLCDPERAPQPGVLIDPRCPIASTRADGTFVIDAVLPGRYIAAAVDVPGEALDDRDLLEQIASFGTPVELEELRQHRLALRLSELPE
jgi:protocatechuate 3,4-dioxygenase beta subunit